jgi:hypothetical protein
MGLLQTKVSRLALVTVTIAVSSLFSACSSSSDGGDVGIAPGSLDIAGESLTAQGCLDLTQVTDALRRMPGQAHVRRHTQNFSIEPLEADQPLRKNFIALAAIAQFSFDERAAGQSLARLPVYSQTGCQSVDVIDSSGVPKTFTVVPSENRASIHIQREDGTSQVWTLKGPREIELVETSLTMDPCPHYMRAKTTTMTTLTWGTESDIAKAEVPISRSYLRAISTAVIEMPEALKALATFDQEDAIVAPLVELRDLKVAAIDPQIHQCPYKANPPSGEEPPPRHD